MFFVKTGRENKKAWKASGGIAVLVKETLRNACKFEPVSDSDVVWVRVQKDIAKLNSWDPIFKYFGSELIVICI